MGDSEPVVISAGSSGDLVTMLLDIIGSMRIKLWGLIFILFILVNSSPFVNRILSNVNGATIGKSPTNYGIMLQGLALIIAGMLLDAASSQNIL